MLKKRNYPVSHDFKTGILFKISLFLGITLFCIFVILKLFAILIDKNSVGILRDIYIISNSTLPETIIAFSIILIGVGIILYFFYRQFLKLGEIANEIENSEEFNDF